MMTTLNESLALHATNYQVSTYNLVILVGAQILSYEYAELACIISLTNLDIFLVRRFESGSTAYNLSKRDKTKRKVSLIEAYKSIIMDKYRRMYISTYTHVQIQKLINVQQFSYHIYT